MPVHNLLGKMMAAITVALWVAGWRFEYNTFRPHSALGYLPPAPEAVMLSEDYRLSRKTG